MITINLGSGVVTWTILAVLAAIGWSRGFRYMLSIAIFVTLGYVLTVQGGDFVVGLVNRFYSNGPRLASFALGRDPSTVTPLTPLIPDNFQAPLLLRLLVFVALMAVGIGYAWPWEGKPLAGFNGFRPLRILGALAGLYIGVLTITAISTFWAEAAAAITLPDLAVTALNGLPNLTAIIPSVIAAFLILLVIIIIIRFNRVWKP